MNNFWVLPWTYSAECMVALFRLKMQITSAVKLLIVLVQSISSFIYFYYFITFHCQNYMYISGSKRWLNNNRPIYIPAGMGRI